MQVAIHKAAKGKIKKAPPKANETLSNGSIVHWSEADERYVPVTCSKCQIKRTMLIDSVNKGKRGNYTGYCQKCRNRKFYEDEPLPNGSIIHWSAREPSKPADKIWVTCGKCGEKRLRSFPGGKIRGTTFTGYCLKCSNNWRDGDEVLDNGTIIHWGERKHSSHRNTQVAVTCAGCQEKKFLWQGTIDGPGWPKLCPDCRPEWRGQNRRPPKEDLWSGSVIHWGEEIKKKVSVTCGYCGQPRMAYRSTVLAKHKDPNWTGCCRKHSNDPDLTARTAFYSWLIEKRRFENRSSGKQNQVVHSISSTVENRSRGRQSGAQFFDRGKFLEDIKAIIQMLWNKPQSAKGITREDVAKEFQLRGQDIGAYGVKKRLKICGVTMKWNDFVGSILRERA